MCNVQEHWKGGFALTRQESAILDYYKFGSNSVFDLRQQQRSNKTPSVFKNILCFRYLYYLIIYDLDSATFQREISLT